MAMQSKKKIMIAAIAGSMAAALIIGGGSFAYLKSNSETVTNNFNPNTVEVELVETTDNQYEIIPGEVDEKDPKVTVNTTTPAYVFVTIVDKTNGLVTYEVEQGWTELPSLAKSTSTSTTKVYYKDIDGYYDKAEKKWYTDENKTEEIVLSEMSVLKNDKVSYDAALENSDMVKPNGTLKTGQTISFTAYAIQKGGFDTPEDAYNGTSIQVLSDYGEDGKNPFNTTSAGSFMLKDDITVPDSVYAGSRGNQYYGSKDLDMNGKTMTYDYALPEGTTATVQNNSVIFTMDGILGGANSVIENGTIADTPENPATGITNAYRGKSTLTLKNMVVDVYGVEAVYSSGKGTTVIESGFYASKFSTTGNKYFTLNKLDGSAGNIEAKGGTYKNFDPANNLSENPAVSFVADGYHSECFKINNNGTVNDDTTPIDLHTNYDNEDYAFYFVVVPDGQTATYTGTMTNGIPQFTIA